MHFVNEKDFALKIKKNLRPENEILNGWKPNQNYPIISICCATFNHVKFIEDAICSFLSQTTNYRFEIIIRDDASTDGTTSIIERYALKYPNIIRAIINSENLFKKGERPRDAWPILARGKYIALCEGDDFWISHEKLDHQINFLEQNNEYGLSCHFSLSTTNKNIFYPMEIQANILKNGFFFSAKDILNQNFVPTNTTVFRAQLIKDIPPYKLYIGDWPLWIHICSKTKGYYHKDIFSFYRQHDGGVWSRLKLVEVVGHTIDFYDYIEQVIPSLGEDIRKNRKNYIVNIARAHQELRENISSLIRNPIKFFIRKFFKI